MFEGFLAATVDPVGEDDERFSALLLFHQFVGREIDGVVEKSAGTAGAVPAMAAITPSACAGGSTAARTCLQVLRRVDLVDGRVKLLVGGGEILEEFDLAIEVDEEGLVLVFAQEVVEEHMAGGDFLRQEAALTAAGVDKQAEGEGQVRLTGEIGDGMGLGVLLEQEIVFGEVVDECAMFVADGGEEIDGGDVDGDWRSLPGDQRGNLQITEHEKAREAEGSVGGEHEA